MPNHFDRTLVDPSITDEEIQLAHDAKPVAFPDVDAQDDVGDDLSTAHSFVVTPATPGQALLNARHLRDNHVNVGVGRCLATVRGPIFGLPAADPDANAGFDHAAPLHRFADLSQTPRGMVVWFRNPDHGHVVLSVGGGLCSSTDFHEPGFEGIALLSRVAAWCGATDVAGGEVLERFDVWPTPAKPKPAPKPLTLAERIGVVRHDLHEAQAAGHDWRARRLKLWLEQLQKRQAAK